MSLKHILEKLGDQKLPTKLGSKEEEFKIVEEEFGSEKATFSLGAETGVEVSLFNSAEDIDDDDIFGKEEQSTLSHRQGMSYLKYQTNVGIKLKSGLEIKKIGFSIDANQQIIASSYRLHDNEEKVGEAVVSDMLSFKSIFSASQIKSLEEGEALHLAFNGALEGKAEASWSDIFSGTLSQLSSWLDNEALKLKVSAEASVSFSLKVEDSFKLVLNKISGDRYQLSIKKNHIGTKGISASAGITVGFEDSEAVTSYAKKLIEALFDENQATIEKIVEKDLIGSLSQSQRNTLDGIAERFGWDIDDNLLEKLKEEYLKASEKVVEKVKEIAEKTIKAGFNYDYKRIAKSDTVFNAILIREEAINTFHKDLLLMRVDKLIDTYRSGSDLLEEVTFLEKSVAEKSHTWGFSLGLGKWKATDLIEESIKLIKEENQDSSKVAYDARKRFSNFLGQTGTTHKVDFNASMEGFTSGSEPLASSLDYSLFLDYSYTEKVLKRPELNQFLDLARIWQALPPADFAKVGDEVFSEIKGFENITLKCEIKFDKEAFRTMIPALKSLGNRTDIIAKSLGKAMLYWEKYDLRKDPDKRAGYYGQLWQFYFANPDLSSGFYAEKARAVIKEQDKKLAAWEYKYKKTPAAYYAFGFAINNNPNTHLNWEYFNEGVALLAEGISSASVLTHDKVVPAAFNKMQKFWRHPLHLKALGIYLLEVAKQYPLVWEHVNRSATITFEKDREKQNIIIS